MASPPRYYLLCATLLVFFIPSKGMVLNLQDKTANQSSLFRTNYANLAVDGERSTWAHTVCVDLQWWMIDLGATYRLTKVAIFNRPDRFRGRLQGVDFRAGISPTFSKNERIVKITYAQSNSRNLIEIPLQPSRLARYVSAQTTVVDTCLHFAELTLEGDLASSTGEILDFSCLNTHPVLSSQTERTEIAGYVGSAELEPADAGVTIARRFFTGTGRTLPYSCTCVPLSRTDNGVVRQYMDCDNNVCSCGGTSGNCLYRIGAFACQIDTGDTLETITTVTLNADAEILPERQTVTVSRDDAVSLRVTTPLDTAPAWRWRRTSESFDAWLEDWFDHPVLNISRAAVSHGGVYECHRAMSRGQGKHAIFRLIVRACPGSLWGPSDGCLNECPMCYNGGMCHDVTGQCICPPGFSGAYCQYAHGRNVFGLSGALRCSEAGGLHGEQCRGRLFCLQDPFGCTCAPGYKGLACDEECDQPNTYGPYCSQACHCAAGIQCLNDTGHCNDPDCSSDNCPQLCAHGWKGLNCQVETPCQLGHYGDLCLDRCYCRDNQSCDDDSGDCSNGCADGFIGASCTEDGRLRVEYLGQTDKPNAGQAVTVRCTVVGNPLPFDGDISLSSADGQEYGFLRSDVAQDLNAFRRTNEYLVPNAQVGDALTCHAIGSGGNQANSTLRLDVFELPFLVSAPRQQGRGSDNITVAWGPWVPDRGQGDGPVERYEVHYRLASEEEEEAPYTGVVRALSNTSTSATVVGLEVDTEYDFVVVVVRGGEGGTGKPSSTATLKTLCGIPTMPATFTVEAQSATQLHLMWELPPSSAWQCRNVSAMYVYTQREPSPSFVNSGFSAHRLQAVLNYFLPCEKIGVKVLFTNLDGVDSPFSDTKQVATATTVPGPVVFLRVFELTGDPYDKLGLLWSAPEDNHCPVEDYTVVYTLTSLDACTLSDLTPLTRAKRVSGGTTTVSLSRLRAFSEYRVSVIASNGVGNSTAETITFARPSAVSTFVPTVSVSDSEVTSTSIQFRWDRLPCEEQNDRSFSYRTDFNDDDSLDVPWGAVRKTSLSPCTTYHFSVAVKNSQGVGPFSNVTNVTTDAAVPSRVTIQSVVEVEENPTVLRVSWYPDTGSCPIDNYTVSYRLTERFQCGYSSWGALNVSGVTTGTTHNITGLLPHSTYWIYVTAATAAGSGSISVSQAGQTAPAAPSEPPTAVSLQGRKKRALSFQWDPPSCEGSRGLVLGYAFLLRDLERASEDRTGETNGVTRETEIIDLVPYTKYAFRVLAFTEAGNGPYSQQLAIRTDQAKPPQVPGVTSPSADSSSITVRWQRPDPPNGIIVAYHVYSFVVSRKEDTRQTVNVTEGLNQTVLHLVLAGLEPDSNYSVQVRAVTVREGSFSQPIYRVTQEGIPGIPAGLAITDTKETELTVTWEAPDQPNGRILGYKVTYSVKYKPYDTGFRPDPSGTVSRELSESARSYVIDSLVPGTKYEVAVSAATRIGEGDPAVTEGYTNPTKDIPAPVKPTFNPDMSTKTTVAISLPAVESVFVVSYLVTVRKLDARRRRQAKVTADGEEFDSYDKSPDSYVAAEIDKDNRADVFVIGDNKTYGSYTNPPLQEGTTYEIRTGSASKTDDDLTVSWSEKLVAKAGQSGLVTDPDGGDGRGGGGGGGGGGSSPIGAIIGVCVAIVAVTIVVAAVVYKRRLDHQKPKTSEAVGMTPVNSTKEAAKPVAASPKLSHAASEDTLTNLVNKAGPGPAAPKRKPTAAASAATLPANIQQRPTVRAPAKPAVPPGPVKVNRLAEYVRGKTAKGNDGFKKDYGGLLSDQARPMDIAKEDKNKTKNRYANIIAYDHSRVVLDLLPGDPYSDYINASYIDGYKHPKKYIAAQGPNMTSTNDMWRMIWQENSTVIVMVTHLVEGGKKKCEQYWPDTTKKYGEIGVTLETETKSSNHTIRTFTVIKGDKTRRLTQYHFTSWPDMGLPQFSSPLLNFVSIVKEGHSSAADLGPIIVHCSAGVGRTGTFITIDAMLDQAKAEGQIDVLDFVGKMRENRVRMVQTQEQYIFIFEALLEWFLVGKTWVVLEDLRRTVDKLRTPSARGNFSMLQEEFDKLKKLQPAAKADRFRGGKDPANANKNRVASSIPLDRSRPYLMTMVSEQSTNYINASFINGYWNRDQYIVTQLPLANTVSDFWSMVYDYKSTIIVMLNPLDPKDETLCKYWPEKSLCAYGPYTVELTSVESYDTILCRTFTLSNLNKPNEEAHTIRQLEFQAWPTDSDVPSSTMALLNLIYNLEMWQESSTGPITVQCIDGSSCSGVFCAILFMLDRMKTEKIVDVFQSVKTVRTNRPSAITKLTQYQLCYEAALMHLESFDIYANFR